MLSKKDITEEIKHSTVLKYLAVQLNTTLLDEDEYNMALDAYYVKNPWFFHSIGRESQCMPIAMISC